MSNDFDQVDLEDVEDEIICPKCLYINFTYYCKSCDKYYIDCLGCGEIFELIKNETGN